MPDSLPPTASRGPRDPLDPLDDARAVMRQILSPEGGCAWSRAKTHESLLPYLIEESYEFVDAVREGTPADEEEELGDLLYQLLFHTQLAENAHEGYTLDTVAHRLATKLRHRHPHVFEGDGSADIDEIYRVWSARKRAEKASRTSILDGIPASMPSIALAVKTVDRLNAATGHAQGEPAPVRTRAALEAEQVRTLAASRTAQAWARLTHDSLGESLLALVVAAREEGIDAEAALRDAVGRLHERVRLAEASSPAHGATGDAPAIDTGVSLVPSAGTVPDAATAPSAATGPGTATAPSAATAPGHASAPEAAVPPHPRD